jgi:hypothetical protein
VLATRIDLGSPPVVPETLEGILAEVPDLVAAGSLGEKTLVAGGRSLPKRVEGNNLLQG